MAPRSPEEKARLDLLIAQRNDLIRQLWLVYRDMSDILTGDDFPSADLDLWDLVTDHEAVQSRLRDEGEK